MTKTTTELLTTERERQIAKGFDEAHDDQHVDREIISDPNWGAETRLHRAKWTKNRDEYVSQLVQVAAMIVAEIERASREISNG